MSEVKLCKDCAHYRHACMWLASPIIGAHECHRPQMKSIVTGKQLISRCDWERAPYPNVCGPDAKFWEPKR